jgi:hypothetical protein
VFFVDCCSLTEEKENSVLVAVTLTGTFVCRKSRGKMHFLKEVQLFLRDSKPSFIVLFVD